MKDRKSGNCGFTLVELMVVVVVVGIAILGISGVIAGAHKDYSIMFKRVHGEITNDAYAARLRFDKICRSAKAGSAVIDNSIPSLELYFYSTPNVNGSAILELSPPDSFAKFYLNGTQLMLETSTIGNSDDIAEVLARNVTELEFSYVSSKNIQMVMTLDKDPANNSDYAMTITCGSIMHN